MTVTTHPCDLVVNRGPGWLFVRPRNLDPDGPDADELADRIWSLLEKHLTYRLVLELDEIDVLRSALIAQLLRLRRQVVDHGGVLRLSGLSDPNRDVLEICRLGDRLPTYRSRVDALMAARPCQPR